VQHNYGYAFNYNASSFKLFLVQRNRRCLQREWNPTAKTLPDEQVY
jgi:hypothetical protein